MSRDQLRAAAEAEVTRWEKAIGDELGRLLDRQEAVVLARLQGTKARKHTRHWQPPSTRPLEVKAIIDPARWVMDAASSVTPLIRRLFGSVYKRTATQVGGPPAPDDTSATEEAVKARVDRVAQGVETIVGEVEAFIAAEEESGSAMPDIVSGVRDLYEQRRDAWTARLATLSAVGSINHAALLAAMDNRCSAKQWLSMRDTDVRPTHAKADGQVRLLDERFRLGGIPAHPGKSLLMFPGDPSKDVPIEEVINCRCTLLFSPPRKSLGHPSDDDLAAEREVGILGSYSTAEREWLEAKDAAPAVGSVEPCSACGTPLRFNGADWPEAADHSSIGCPEGGSHQPASLEAKARVRTAAGAAAYGQPIGSVIVPNPVGTSGSTPNVGAGSVGASSSRPPRVGTIAGSRVADASNDPTVRALVAKYSPAGAVPDPATTSILAMTDKRGRIGGYVVWQNADGASPKGSIVAVSVHPALQGQRIGDQLVALAATQDPAVVVTTRPRASAPAPARAASASTRAPRASQARQTPAAAPGGLPVVRSRAQAGDQPGTSGDFDADAARIERLQKAYMRDRMDTTSLFSRGGRWTPAREKEQQAIIDHFLTKPGVKADHKLLVIGGLPGAGKTTTINSQAGQAAVGIDLSEYVAVNADEVKAEMIARGMVPDYPGLTADESATLFHAESFEVAHSLMRQAARKGLNFAYDTSLKSSSQASFATDAAARAKARYQSTFVFVDVPVAVAKQRAKARYLAGDRYMPLALIDSMKAYGGGRQSLPSSNFDQVKGNADRWVAFDNAGTDPVVLGQGSRRARRP